MFLLNDSNNNYIGFVLKPDVISERFTDKMESILFENNFEIVNVSKKQLAKSDLCILHCFNGSWRMNFEEYAKYMTSDYSIGYLTKHSTLRDKELFDFALNVRGTDVRPECCAPSSLRKIFYDMSPSIFKETTTFQPNFVHVTASNDELRSFLELYFINNINVKG